MNISRKRHQIKEWWNLSKSYFNQIETVGNLSMKLGSTNATIFIDRIQPTKGFIIAKPLDYIVPNDFGNNDACSVTVYRNASVDVISDDIINLGTKDDVRVFYCRHFSGTTPCNHECKYRATNNQSFELSEMVDRATQELAEIDIKRKSAWKQIFTRRK